MFLSNQNSRLAVINRSHHGSDRTGILRLLALATIVLIPVTARSQSTQRGAALGGLAGAVTGGLIGNRNNNAGAGAAIGGVIGAVTGGVLGNANDKERAVYQQQLYQQQAIQARASVSVADVVSMCRSGLSNGVIINQIQQRGVQNQLQVPDIIALHQQGVPENVITAMQQASVGPQGVIRERIVAPPPVIVEEHYVVPPYAPRYHYYRHAPIYHHRGFQIGF